MVVMSVPITVTNKVGSPHQIAPESNVLVTKIKKIITQ